MKKSLNLMFLGLLLFCFSCGDEAKSEQPAANKDQVITKEGKHDTAALHEGSEPVAVLNGRYRKLIKNQPASDCNCNCIDVDFDKPSEWCIIKDKVYISAQCRKSGDNSVDLYFIGMSREDAPDRPLPWQDFDTDQPIASINFQPSGDAELDWKGFSIDGKIATDYAIFGKKTLEGTYKKD
ncbi:MAG: hypothetical protein WBL27_12010 [Salinimicrobium sp.]